MEQLSLIVQALGDVPTKYGMTLILDLQKQIDSQKQDTNGNISTSAE